MFVYIIISLYIYTYTIKIIGHEYRITFDKSAINQP